MPRPAISLTCATLGFAAVVVASQPQQITPQPFRAGIDIVHVDVSVLDRDRKPVQGLAAADFTILEDGKPRPLAAFTAVSLPEPVTPTVAWTRDVAPDVVTNSLPQQGRLVVIMFNAIRSPNMPIARQIGSSVVNELGPDDLAAVVYARQGVPQNFTADRSRLLTAVNRPVLGLGEAEDPSDSAVGQCRCGVCALEAIKRIADAVRDVPQRRKVLFLLSESIPVQTTGDCAAEIKKARDEAFRATDVANLTVNPIDPTGLETLATMADRPTVARPSPNRLPIVESHLKRIGDLKVYADRTGGRAITENNAPQELLHDIIRESSSYYALGFAPAKPATDGKFHKIEVKVNRRDVTIQARKGYYAAGGRDRSDAVVPNNTPPPLFNALSTLWPKSDVPLTISAATFQDPEKARFARVATTIGAGAIPETLGGPKPESARHKVSVFVGAFDRNGRSVNYHVQSLELPTAKLAGTSVQYEVLTDLPLKPGRYELRGGVRDDDREVTGSVYTYVDVPDFTKAPFSVSGVVVQAQPGPLAAPARAFQALMPVVPTVRRTFARTDRVATFLRIYQAADKPALPVTVAVRIVGESPSVQPVDERDTIAPDRFGSSHSADYQFGLPINTLTAGQYLLTITVTNGSRSERRQVRFNVQ
jgi:VWFA-related protein